MYFPHFSILCTGQFYSCKYASVLIEVIPFGGSIDDRGLTYFVQDDLAETMQVGSLVEVPFRSGLDMAVVTRMGSEENPENLKSIGSFLCSIPLLAPYQVAMIFALSSYYMVHAHQILSLLLPKGLVRYLEKKSFAGLEMRKRQEKRQSSEIHFIHHTDSTPLSPLIKQYVWEKKEGVAIIFPDDFAIEWYLRDIGWTPDDNSLIIPNNLSPTRKYKSFMQVYNGEKNIIIWTRGLLYYNLSHYPHILYVEDALNKRSMRFQHTYKHLDIVDQMAQSRLFDITILSSLPSIESMYRIHTEKYKISKI